VLGVFGGVWGLLPVFKYCRAKAIRVRAAPVLLILFSTTGLLLPL